jgi:hypothetical protein
MRRPWSAIAGLLALTTLACDDAPVASAPVVPAPFGALRVTNAATGPIYPGSEYIHLQLGPTQTVSQLLNSSLTIDSLAPGPVSLAVDLQRSQCIIPQNPIPVVIPNADTARVDLVITCVVTWGTLGVELPTSGPNQPSLLTVTLDGANIGGASPNTAGLAFPYIPAGSHVVGVTGLGANCAVAEPNPQTVVVPLDDTVQVTFTITCA